ncbi:putative transcription factor GRAS family [Helianthus annuus]|nr:putative transcription factor GRAS family [Helianthus annuus]KAJ0776840.1 putative transcription factor GRAS family [Helianthus annuus]
MLHVKEGEIIGINCIFQLHKLLYDHSGNTLKDFLGLINSTNPSIIVMAEQGTEHNDVVLEQRVSNSLKYYSAIFNCIDYVVSLQYNNQIKIEEMFGREIRNIIACEGLERFEHHVAFDQWGRLMTALGGLVNVGVNDQKFVQSKMILKMYGASLLKVEKKMFDGGMASGIMLSW